MPEARRFINNGDYYYFFDKPTHITGLTLNKTGIVLTTAGQTEQLTATITPSGAVETQIYWTSSDTSVATVSDTGLVTCVTPGTCTITATCSGFSATCGVYNVIPKVSVYLVGGGGRGGTGMCYQCRTGAGGGAGGVWEINNVTLQPGSYTITVGEGGYKCDYSVNDGKGDGCPSCIKGTGVNYCVCGGGRGGGAVCCYNGSVGMQSTGASGGSGGGGGFCNFAGGSHVGCGLGNSGGHGQCTCSGAPRYSGGGGGAGHAGADAYGSNGCGYGGIGVCTTFFGAAMCIAGGGNGGGDVYAPANCKRDGSGTLISNSYGGGRGGARYCKGCPATCYGGGGGGGGNCSNVNAGGAGYQGIVGVRYPVSCGYNFITGGCKYQCTIGGVAYCIHCFTSSGTLNVG